MSACDEPIWWWSAEKLTAAIAARQLSSVEVVKAFMQRIEALDGTYNAFLSVVSESEALRQAEEADRAVQRGEDLGPLHGLPIAVKDLMDVRGLPTTNGTCLPSYVASSDSVLAENLRKAGAIIVGKTNTPEYGLGTLTFNGLKGPTRNPWSPERHAGGSSGGAAAAVAAGMLPLADGSDSGGSIRYPASFCNLVGLRPSAGRVPSGRLGDVWSPHGVLGPIARNVRDTGLLLSAISGFDMRAPLSVEAPTAAYTDIKPCNLEGLRIGWSRTIGGLPIDTEVTCVLEDLRGRLTDRGCIIEEWEPEFENIDRCWEIIELFQFFSQYQNDVVEFRSKLRPDFVRNVEEGGALSPSDIAWALGERTNIFRSIARMLERYDVLAMPATPVFAPFSDVEWVHEISGTKLKRYFEWQRCATRVTVMAHPALSVPAGFSREGLPLGVQLVGRYRDELSLLRCGAAIERMDSDRPVHPSDGILERDSGLS